jgi:TRAP-type mannitol/chloroaromatic compound transport system permease small subunit
VTLLRKIADRLIGLSALIGGLCLMGLVGVIIADVVGRALGSPLFGSQDMITMGMAILVFGGMALCDRSGGHIAVDLLEPRFPAAMNRAIDIIAAVAGTVIFLMIAYTLHESRQVERDAQHFHEPAPLAAGVVSVGGRGAVDHHRSGHGAARGRTRRLRP